DCGDRRAPVLTARYRRVVRLRAGRVVVNDFRPWHDAGPDALHETTISLTDTDGLRRAIRNVGDANVAVAVEDSVKWLPLIAAAERVGVAGASSPQAADVTAHGAVCDRDGRVSGRRGVAAVGEIDLLRPGVARTEVG